MGRTDCATSTCPSPRLRRIARFASVRCRRTRRNVAIGVVVAGMFAACAGTFPVLALAEASYSDVAIECFQAAADDRWSTRELCEEAANRGSPHAMLILAERTESDSRKAGLLSRAVE